MAASREWFDKDYYKVLGVSDKATEAEIKRAHRKLAKQLHPDANPDDKKAEERFKEVSAAYEVLRDPERRKEYDEVRRLGPVGAATGGGGGGPFGGGGGGGPGFTTSFRVDDLGDLLGGMFGGNRRTRGGGAGPRRGEDLEAELHLRFADALAGVTTTVNVTSAASCTTCNGTGAAPGTSPVICSQCGGRGVLDDNQGLFGFSRPCTACRGTGMRVETPCPTCAGSGIVRRPRQVKVRVPAGVEDGSRIRLKQRGGAGANGGPAGDLYVTVHVDPHELFGRSGHNLTLTVPVTFAEAALGASVTVPTMDSPVTLKVPPGTRSGRTFRVRGKGVSGGDLLVTVEVSVPQKLSKGERDAIEALAAATPESPRSHLGV